LRDAIELEWEGTPTVAIIADALVGSAEAMKKVSGMPDYPYVVVPYPVGTLSDDEVAALAKKITPEIIGLLTSDREVRWVDRSGPLS